MNKTPFKDPRGLVYADNLGAVLLGMLNGVKHTKTSFANLYNINVREIDSVLNGQTAPNQALINAIEKHCPLNLKDLYHPSVRNQITITNDTDGGVRICRAEDTAATRRTFSRGPTQDQTVPYYDYADTAASRMSLFRPEWIAEKYVYDGKNPELPDWTFNKGHFEHQMTFFLGEVNFHWRDRDGNKHVFQTQTGDMNYNTPFVPHTFTTRTINNGVILAVTYGGGLSLENFQIEISKMSLDQVIEKAKKLSSDLSQNITTSKRRGVIVNEYAHSQRTAQESYSEVKLMEDIPFQPNNYAHIIQPLNSNFESYDRRSMGEQWGYVLKGTAQLCWNGQQSSLKKDDSFLILPDTPFAFTSEDSKAEILILNIDPKKCDPWMELAHIYKFAGENAVARVKAETEQWFS